MKNTLDLKPILLPTKDISPLFFGKYTNNLCINQRDVHIMENGRHQHLYLCSQREIKEGDYFMNKTRKGDTIFKCDGGVGLDQYNIDNYVTGTPIDGITRMSMNKSRCFRIEFTTDKKLIADGVPAILESVIKEFINRYNGEQKEVNVEKLVNKLWDKRSKKYNLENTAPALFKWGVVDTLQDNDKKFSLEDMRMLAVTIHDWCNDESDSHLNLYQKTNQLIQSLTKEPKGLEMYCELEILSTQTSKLYGIETTWMPMPGIDYTPKIKLINGQPVIHFK